MKVVPENKNSPFRDPLWHIDLWDLPSHHPNAFFRALALWQSLHHRDIFFFSFLSYLFVRTERTMGQLHSMLEGLLDAQMQISGLNWSSYSVGNEEKKIFLCPFSTLDLASFWQKYREINWVGNNLILHYSCFHEIYLFQFTLTRGHFFGKNFVKARLLQLLTLLERISRNIFR